MDIKSIFINMAILGLLVFGIISFVVVTQGENGVPTNQSFGNHSMINISFSELSGNLSSSQSQAETTAGNFGNVTPTTTYGELDVQSIFSTTNTLKSLTLGLWNVFVVLPMGILGVSPIIAGVISSIIVLLLIIGIWAVWKGVISV